MPKWWNGRHEGLKKKYINSLVNLENLHLKELIKAMSAQKETFDVDGG